MMGCNGHKWATWVVVAHESWKPSAELTAYRKQLMLQCSIK